MPTATPTRTPQPTPPPIPPLPDRLPRFTETDWFTRGTKYTREFATHCGDWYVVWTNPYTPPQVQQHRATRPGFLLLSPDRRNVLYLQWDVYNCNCCNQWDQETSPALEALVGAHFESFRGRYLQTPADFLVYPAFGLGASHNAAKAILQAVIDGTLDPDGRKLDLKVGGIRFVTTTVRLVKAPTKDEWVAAQKAAKALSILRDVPPGLASAKGALLEVVKSTRAAARAESSKKYRVELNRRGVEVAGPDVGNKKEALTKALERLSTRRQTLKRAIPDVRGRIGGVRLEGGWFVREMAKKRVDRLFQAKVPTAKPAELQSKRYLGIEVECMYTRDGGQRDDDHRWLAEKLAMAGLYDDVNLGSDGSISQNDDRQNTVEARILVDEDRLEDVVRRFCAVMREVKGEVNNSCGLHVHVDCRSRDFKVVYKRLVAAQPLLFALVHENRRNNHYCQKNRVREIGEHSNGGGDRYHAINSASHQRHGTIEVRLHGGTLNETKIVQWCKLLVALADGPDFERFPSRLTSLQKKLGFDQTMMEHLESRIREFNGGVSPLPFVEARKRARRKKQGTPAVAMGTSV